jgi:catechol 2,3-dioxygenase-like lactoylglutathione lyase family enzyme
MIVSFCRIADANEWAGAQLPRSSGGKENFIFGACARLLASLRGTGRQAGGYGCSSRRGTMLGKADATPMIAVKDLDRARKFYEGTLGLETKDEMGGEVLTMKSGDTLINVYRSEFAGTNQATALTFAVGDIDKEVGELKEKGIFFEHYDLPGLEQQGDLHVAEGFKTAWFKDPDGNILSLIEGE